MRHIGQPLSVRLITVSENASIERTCAKKTGLHKLILTSLVVVVSISSCAGQYPGEKQYKAIHRTSTNVATRVTNEDSFSTDNRDFSWPYAADAFKDALYKRAETILQEIYQPETPPPRSLTCTVTVQTQTSGELVVILYRCWNRDLTRTLTRAVTRAGSEFAKPPRYPSSIILNFGIGELFALYLDEPLSKQGLPSAQRPASSSSEEVVASEARNQSERRSALTMEVQSRLAALGYDPGPIDGVSGQLTSAAIRKFQRDTNLPPDGKPTEELLGQLNLVISMARQLAKEPELTGSGSGFFVNEEGYIVTNNHVIDGCKAIKLSESGKTYDVEIYAVDKYNDLALLKAPAVIPSVAVLSTSSGVKLGEKVMTAGYPLRGLIGSGLNVTTGIVSSLSGPGDDKRFVQITAPVQPGNSGGPLLDLSGHVIGVVVAKLDALKVVKVTGDIPANVAFGLKGVLVRAFLDLNGIAYQSATSSASVGETAAAQNAEKFTVAVECWE